MNCKSGDLAIVVYSERPENVGALVKVLHLYDAKRWKVEVSSRSMGATPEGKWVPVKDWPSGVVINDAYLRPIRDPGEDARDETLSWKRVPSPAKQGEPA